MATWYLNAGSVSPDGITPATGYHTFTDLLSAHPSIGIGDTVLFVDNGTIVEPSAPIIVPDGLTISSYLNTLPTWAIPTASSPPFYAIYFNRITVTRIKMQSATPSVMTPTLLLIRIKPPAPTINSSFEQCEFYNSQIDQDYVNADATCSIYYVNNIFTNLTSTTQYLSFFNIASSSIQVYVINNVFSRPSFFIDALVAYSGGTGEATSSIILNNIFYGENGGSSINYGGSAAPLLTDYNCYWNISIPVYMGPHDVNANPVFVDSINADYRLQTGSPCINTGIGNNFQPYVPLVDFDGATPRDPNTPNIGVYEGSVTTTTTTTTTTTSTTPSPTTTTTTSPTTTTVAPVPFASIFIRYVDLEQATTGFTGEFFAYPMGLNEFLTAMIGFSYVNTIFKLKGIISLPTDLTLGNFYALEQWIPGTPWRLSAPNITIGFGDYIKGGVLNSGNVLTYSSPVNLLSCHIIANSFNLSTDPLLIRRGCILGCTVIINGLIFPTDIFQLVLINTIMKLTAIIAPFSLGQTLCLRNSAVTLSYSDFFEVFEDSSSDDGTNQFSWNTSDIPSFPNWDTSVESDYNFKGIHIEVGPGPYVQYELGLFGSDRIDIGATGAGSPNLNLPRIAPSANTIDFTASVVSGPSPLTVVFTAVSTAIMRIIKYTWDFGDGYKSNEVSPQHTYNEGGNFTVNLEVIYENRIAYKKIKSNYIAVFKVKMIASENSGESPFTVKFSAVPSLPEDVQIATYDWDFGDGTGHSIEVSPVHTFIGVKRYQVNLINSFEFGVSTTPSPVTPTTTTSGPTTTTLPPSLPGFYVDLGLGTDGHLGTFLDPFSWNDFNSSMISGIADATYYIKGSKTFSSNIAILLGKSLIMNAFLPWDPEINGPWRIKIDQGVSGSLTVIGTVQNSIIQCPSGPSFTLNLDGCYLLTTHIFLPDTIIVSDNSDGFGSSLIYNYTSVGAGQIQINGGLVCSFYDCVLETRFAHGLPGIVTVSLINCVTPTENYSFMKNDIDVLLSAKTQYNWTPPTWPLWSADKQNWSSNILSVGIGTPPEIGSYPYYKYDRGFFAEVRTGIGAFYFESPSPVPIPGSFTSELTISATQEEVKLSGKMTCLGWIKNITVADGDVIIPLAVADVYENVIGTDAAIRMEILREGVDYRLQYSGSKSKPIDKTLKIKVNDGFWHFLGYESDENGNMTYYIDGFILPSEEGLDSFGLPLSVAKSFSPRVGGGSVWAPYLYKRGQVIYQYNWRFGKDFNLGLEWIQKLMEKDKPALKIV